MSRPELKFGARGVPAALQRIAYCHGSELRFFNLEILKLLKRDYGAEIHVFCNFPEQTSFYDQALNSGDVASVNTLDMLNVTRRVAPEERARVIAEARENERVLATTYNRLIMGHRTFGHAFSIGGFYHPRAIFAQEADYYQVLDALNRTLSAWNSAFDRHRFTLVVNPTLELSYVAESRNVPMRRYIMSGQGNLYFWTTNRYDECADLDRAMEAMPDRPPVEIEGTYGSNAALMAQINRDIRLDRCFYLAAKEVARRLYWRLRRYRKARSYRISDASRFYFRRRSQMHMLRRLATTRLPDLAGKRFVFFPLHEEPETVLTVGAPERIDQLAAVAAVARDLPAGVFLAVKETYFGVGRRPSEFYRQIANFKNVVLLDVTEPGLEVGRNADAVVTIRGTVGQEAGILGRPVIYLARHTTYHAIPHARYSDIDLGLKDALAWALDEKFDFDRARIDGARFFHSIAAISVDMRGFNRLNQHVFDRDLPAAAVETLVRSLSLEKDASADGERIAM